MSGFGTAVARHALASWQFRNISTLKSRASDNGTRLYDYVEGSDKILGMMN